MSEKNNFSNLQRRNSAVMAKYEWTSSLMNMQKTGNEIHDRRNKTHRKANEFLQGLLQKRSDGSLLDDNGIIDRYERFLKYKSNFNDDDILNEFDRRLRSLNKERRQKQSLPIGLQISRENEPLKSTDRDRTYKRSIPIGLEISQETTDRDRRHKRSIPVDLYTSQETKTESDIRPLKITDQDQHHKRSISVDLEISQETENDVQSLKSTDRVSQLNRNLISSNDFRLNHYQNQRLHRIIVYYQIYLLKRIQLIFVLVRMNINHRHCQQLHLMIQ